MSWISRMRCFSESFKAMCAATVSARRPGSSMPDSEVKTSGGTFLFSFTYCSNCVMIERTRTSISRSSCRSSSASGRDLGREMVADVETIDERALAAFDEHLDRAVGQLQELQDGRPACRPRTGRTAAGRRGQRPSCATSRMALALVHRPR